MAEVRRQKVTTVPFTAGSKEVKTLRKGMMLRELWLTLTGAVTLTAANNLQANILRGDEWAIVAKIEVVGNGNEVFRSFSGNELWWMNRFWYGKSPRLSNTLGDNISANPSFASTLILPFWMPLSARPVDTMLDTSKISDFRIEITWGTFTDIAATASAFTTTPSLDIFSVECFNVVGKFAGTRIYSTQYNQPGANANFQVDLPVNAVYRGLFINTLNAAGTIDTPGIISNVKVFSGSNVFYDVSERALREVQALRVNVQEDGKTHTGRIASTGGTFTAAVNTLPGFAGVPTNAEILAFSGALQGILNRDVGVKRSPSSVADAWYFVDFVSDGYLTEAIDAAGFAELKLELNVTGAGIVRVLPMQVFPVRG